MVRLWRPPALVMFIFGGSDADPTTYYELIWAAGLAPALFLGALTVAIARHYDWRAPAASMLVMVALTALSFMLWLEFDFVTAAPRVSSIVLAALTGLVLVGYLKRQQQAGQ